MRIHQERSNQSNFQSLKKKKLKNEIPSGFLDFFFGGTWPNSPIGQTLDITIGNIDWGIVYDVRIPFDASIGFRSKSRKNGEDFGGHQPISESDAGATCALL